MSPSLALPDMEPHAEEWRDFETENPACPGLGRLGSDLQGKAVSTVCFTAFAAKGQRVPGFPVSEEKGFEMERERVSAIII